MNPKFRCFKTWLVLGCLVLLTVKLAAQSPPDEIKADLQVAAVAIVAEHHTLWLRTGPSSKAIKILLNTRSFSEPVSYKGPPQAQFFVTQEAAEAKNTVEAPLVSTVLAAGNSLLLFLPAADKTTYNLMTTRGADFPYSSFKFVNFSKAQIFIQAGENKKPVTLDPTDSHVFTFRQEEFFSIKVAAKFPDENVRMIRQTMFSIGPDWRELVILYNLPDEERVRTHHLVDTRLTSR